MIHLVEIGPDNWRLGLQVAEDQRRFVSDEFRLLARAYAYREQRSRAFLVYDDRMPVGMGLYHDIPEMECYDFSQLFIDARYQGRGYGAMATRLVLDEMKRDGRYRRVILCYIEGNDAARKLYEQFGFVETDRDEDEIIMELSL
jgi:diamine N-acetyltransferase